MVLAGVLAQCPDTVSAAGAAEKKGKDCGKHKGGGEEQEIKIFSVHGYTDPAELLRVRVSDHNN